MDYLKLRKFDKNLRETSNNYQSMIAVGSIVTGDIYIVGRSDKDIVLIFNTNPISELPLLEKLVKNSNFDQDYLFTPLPKNAFGAPNSKYAFSNKFRSKTLHGKDFVKEAILPSKEKTKEMYTKGLESVSHELYNHIINSSLHSIEKIRDKFWKQFKHAFMYLAIKEYYLTNKHPKTRKELSEKLNCKEINKTFEILHSIDQRNKGEIISCAKNLMNYICSLEK